MRPPATYRRLADVCVCVGRECDSGGARARNIEEEEKMSREWRTRESIVGGGLAEDGG